MSGQIPDIDDFRIRSSFQVKNDLIRLKYSKGFVYYNFTSNDHRKAGSIFKSFMA